MIFGIFQNFTLYIRNKKHVKRNAYFVRYMPVKAYVLVSACIFRNKPSEKKSKKRRKNGKYNEYESSMKRARCARVATNKNHADSTQQSSSWGWGWALAQTWLGAQSRRAETDTPHHHEVPIIMRTPARAASAATLLCLCGCACARNVLRCAMPTTGLLRVHTWNSILM